MSNIITMDKIDDAMIKEFKYGLKLKKAMEDEREIAARMASSLLRRSGTKNVKGLGKHLCEIPDWDYFRMKEKYGQEEVHSKEFLKYLQKKKKDLFTANV